MKQDIETLLGLLGEIGEAYIKMTALSEKKQEFLIRADAQSIGDIAWEEWALLETIAALEERRIEATRKICVQFDIPGGEATLDELAQKAEGDVQEKIMRAGEQLRNIVVKQCEINDQNMALLKLHFEYTNFMMDAFTGADSGGDIYGHMGVMQDTGTKNSAIIDSHV